MNKIRISAFVVMSLALWQGIAFSQYTVLSPEKEKVAQSIDRLLMAPCCWAKTVAEDSSGIAIGIKSTVRDKLAQGETKQSVLDYFEKEYGERIFSSPKKEDFNLLLWLLPMLITPFLFFILLKVLSRWNIKKIKITQETSENSKIIKSESSRMDEEKKYLEQLDKELYGENK